MRGAPGADSPSVELLPEESELVDVGPNVGSVAEDVEGGPLGSVAFVGSLVVVLPPALEADVGAVLAAVADAAVSVSAATPSSLQPKHKIIVQRQLRFDIAFTVDIMGEGVHA